MGVSSFRPPLTGCFCREDLLLFSHPFVYPISYSYQCGLVEIYVMGCSLVLSLLCHSDSFPLGSRDPLRLAPVFLTCPSIFSSTLFLSGTIGQAYLVFSLPQSVLGSVTSPGSLASFPWSMLIRNQGLGTAVLVAAEGPLLPAHQWTEQAIGGPALTHAYHHHSSRVYFCTCHLCAGKHSGHHTSNLNLTQQVSL